MTELEERIGYAFRNAALLERALNTPSLRMSAPDAKDNQRLEFLGDAVLDFLAADMLFAEHPDEQEGMLTVRRTLLVSGHALSAAAETLGLRKWIRRNVGAHELPARAKTLADALEAVVGAVWLDGGLEAARAVFLRLDLPFHEEVDEWSANPKGALGERAQACHPPCVPTYEVLAVTGSAHEPVVTVRVHAGSLGEAEATAVSKSAAEVAAASALLRKLKDAAAGTDA